MRNLLFVLILAFLIAACNTEANKKKISTSEEKIDYSKQPDQVAHNLKVEFVDSVYRVAIINAKRARVFTEKQMTLLDSGIYIEFYSRATGKRISTLSADSMRINDNTHDMTALGRVVVIADSSQTRLETQELEWLDGRRKLHTKTAMKIQSPTRIIYGSGFESDIDLKNYVIYKVSGEEYK